LHIIRVVEAVATFTLSCVPVSYTTIAKYHNFHATLTASTTHLSTHLPMTPHATEDTSSPQKNDNMSNDSAPLTNGETPRSRALSVRCDSRTSLHSSRIPLSHPHFPTAISKRTIPDPSMCSRAGLQERHRRVYFNMRGPVTPRLTITMHAQAALDPTQSPPRLSNRNTAQSHV
jgi:hypothetical protein